MKNTEANKLYFLANCIGRYVFKNQLTLPKNADINDVNTIYGDKWYYIYVEDGEIGDSENTD